MSTAHPTTASSTIAPPTVEKHLLVADDEPGIRRVLQAIFTKDGYTVHLAENGRKALEIATVQPISVLVTDLIMPDMNGVDLLRKVREKRPDVVSVMITAYGTIKTAVDAIRLGAADYITKPFDVGEIRAVVARAVQRQQERELSAVAPIFNGTTGVISETAQSDTDQAQSAQTGIKLQKLGGMIPGESTAMLEVYETIRRAAASRATVLIRGESGTGKELVARALHQNSDRAAGAFVAISCAALPETLLESELFGHEKNAFTGAAAAKPGRFEMADKGTLFLDEIGDISPPVQIKLLRVLQERAFERVGGVKTIKVDVRVVAATNSDLEKLVADNKFRSDLYYRLHVIQINLPPLRERPDDVEVLSMGFLKRFAKENARPVMKIDKDALQILKHYPWPGNVRELENVMERCVVMADPETTKLTLELLPSSVRSNSR
jgi:two-component system, NtrC family, response regulator AtoC